MIVNYQNNHCGKTGTCALFVLLEDHVFSETLMYNPIALFQNYIDEFYKMAQS